MDVMGDRLMNDKVDAGGFGTWTGARRPPSAVRVAGARTLCLLAALVGVLAGCGTGCVNSGTISARELRPEYQPGLVRAAKTLDLAKLGRPSDPEARIQAGDLLEVSCSDLIEERKKDTFPVRVEEDGHVTLPLLSQRMPVAALTAGEAEEVIRTAYVGSGLIRHPQLTVRTVQHKTHTIYVIGAVKKPGIYELQPDECDPLRAIVAAGGVSEDAASVVEVRRSKRPPAPGDSALRAVSVPARGPARAPVPKAYEAREEILRFDLTVQDTPLDPAKLLLHNGDVVSVEQRKRRPFYVAGSVTKPGEFPIPTDREIRVLEAIGLAGGVNMLSEPTHALVIRRPTDMKPVVIRVDLSRAARHPDDNLRLMEGDVVSVVEDAASHTRRAIRQFINFGLFLPML
jgi:polysaccharide export outer membrane protein